MKHAKFRQEIHVKFWTEKLRHRWEDNIRMDLREVSGKQWTGFIWFRIGAGSRLL
jgi:hypothetical protein